MRLGLGGALLLVLLVAACAPVAPPALAPTLTLIPPSAAPVPQTPSATPTPPDLPSVADFATTPTPPPGAQALDTASATLADNLSVPRDALVLLLAEHATWLGAPDDLGCGDLVPPASTPPAPQPGYRFLFEVAGRRYEIHTDALGARVRRCSGVGVVRGTTGALLATDPVAAELVALARARTPGGDDARLLEVRPVVWEDNTLGCALPNVTPVPLRAGGYRIVLAVEGGAEVAYHSDFERVLLCPAGRERLPR